jgi:hypothetical protein
MGTEQWACQVGGHQAEFARLEVRSCWRRIEPIGLLPLEPIKGPRELGMQDLSVSRAVSRIPK